MDEPDCCLWECDDGDWTYITACGRNFTMGEDTQEPEEYMNYCLFCGKPIEIWRDGRRR